MTFAASDVRHVEMRIAHALALRSVHPRIAHAQRALRHDLSVAPRYLYGSEAWRSYRLWALTTFERELARTRRGAA